MDIRPITDGYAVSPQIDPGDLPEIAARGFVTVICNRPDAEVGPDQASDAIRKAAEAAGMSFVFNPVVNGAMGPDEVDAQARTIEGANGPVLAYCRSGTRSCFAWAFGAVETMPVEDIVAAGGQAGYDLGPAVPQLRAMAENGRG
ncbi:TIGR01244 family sulfur transferase [Palleronia sp. LCG004]|uniref:TIGR01244 family sulfur transferase n=1 Tax=Palleronia sp. LCG004 TaxID=3079304 RepID=UPI0029430535|nr:TIGR01244 family sulfur transferase [Palleronia sp. LCG004]WOI55271.1 TIGR01244 family sulfur transferase [Palleronia sp. LCG004]